MRARRFEFIVSASKLQRAKIVKNSIFAQRKKCDEYYLKHPSAFVA